MVDKSIGSNGLPKPRADPSVEFFIVNPETYPCGRQKPSIVDLEKPIAALSITKMQGHGNVHHANAVSMIKQPLEIKGFKPYDFPDARLWPILGFSNRVSILDWQTNWSSGRMGQEVPLQTRKDMAAIEFSLGFSNLSESGLMGENKAYHKGMIAVAAALFTERGLEKYSVVGESPDTPRSVLTAWHSPSPLQGAAVRQLQQ